LVVEVDTAEEDVELGVGVDPSYGDQIMSHLGLE
jgi:hypothetical protein